MPMTVAIFMAALSISARRIHGPHTSIPIWHRYRTISGASRCRLSAGRCFITPVIGYLLLAIRPDCKTAAFHIISPSFDGGAYGRSFVAGSDTHWASTIALGLVPPGTERDKNSKLHGVLREGSKSFRYGFLFGMRAKRAAEIINGTLRAAHAVDPEYVGPKVDGQHALNQFEAATPGLKELREKLDQLAGSNQWVLGLDGRRVPTGAQYKALNRIVTSAEAIICKRWLVRVHNELRRRFTYGWDGDVVITAWVHDELVCCCRPEIADEVGQIMVDFAKEAGEAYRLKVPLDASYAIGRNWAGDPVAERGPGRARKALTEPVRTEEPADIEGGSIMHVRAAKKSNAEPNHDEAERFLRLLDPDEDRFTFQTFDDDVERRDTRAKELAKVNAERAAKGLKPRKKHDPFAGIYHGTLEENWKTLYRLNNEGAGIYITVNATDFKGRSEENIQRVRALFNDLDGVPLEPILKSKHPPHIVVKSSPEHFHPYRLVKDIPLDQFKPLQDRLRAEFGGDVMNDLPRVLRLPGFIHRKHRDVPSLVRIISTPYQGPQYTLKDFEIEVKQEDVPDPFENIAHTLHTAARTPAQKINDEALANLSAWVPEVFPDAQAYKEGGYRVSSAALGRSNEEDLSIVSSGIKDFGVHDLGDPKEGKRSPIDVVMEWKLGIPIEKIIQRNNGEAFTEACDWLKERLPSYKGNGQDTTSPLQHTKSRLLQSSKDFVADFQPPDYLIDGLLQRRYVYALTAPTGNGKTCVVLRIAAHIARGIPLGDIEVERGRVLFFAGENPDDVRSRWIMLCEKMELDPDEMDVFFLAGVHPLDNKKIRAQINAEAAEHGPFSLLIVDTSAAFYTGNDENDNVQLGAHARMLRSFVNLPGGPTVLVTCHPTKHPDFENLLPRGGGSFLAEIDGNLVVLKDAAKVNLTVTTHGKFRGPEFMPFTLS